MTHPDDDRRVIAVDAPEYNATLVKRVDHTPSLASFWVKLDGAPIRFTPGQSITIGAIADGKLWQRPYSVASPPSVAGTEGYELYVRLVAVVRFTTLLWRLQPGARMQVTGPDGGFVLEPGDRRTHLYVATGTAIAPFMAMIMETMLSKRPRTTVLLHGASYVSDLGYRVLLDTLERDEHYPLRYVPTVSRPNDPQNAGWRGRTGRVERVVGAVCDELGLRYDQTVAYLCGNPDMIGNVERVLLDRGFRSFGIKKEPYWAAGPSRPEWLARARVKDMTGSR